MGHKTIVKGIREDFHYNLLTRGGDVMSVPVDSLEEWVSDSNNNGLISFIGDWEDGSKVFLYTSNTSEEFLAHYHDRDEEIRMISGNMKIEYLNDNKKYESVTMKAGDNITMKSGQIHRATALNNIKVELIFKGDE